MDKRVLSIFLAVALTFPGMLFLFSAKQPQTHVRDLGGQLSKSVATRGGGESGVPHTKASDFDNAAEVKIVGFPHTRASDFETPAEAASLAKLLVDEVRPVLPINGSRLLYFFHQLKTGGTAFSRMLGRVYKDKVLPTSQFSNKLDRKGIKNTQLSNITNARIGYSHTPFTGAKTMLEGKLTEPFIRMTFYRHPFAQVASNFFEIHCGVPFRTSAYHAHLRGQGKPTTSDPCVPLHTLYPRQCNEAWCNAMDNRGNTVGRLRRKKCHSLLEFVRDILPLQRGYLPFQGTVGRELIEAVRDGAQLSSDNTRKTHALTLKALKELVFFGLTDRMSESVCLFHFTARTPYMGLTEEDQFRVKKCRPTDNWPLEARSQFRQDRVASIWAYEMIELVFEARLEEARRARKKIEELEGNIDAHAYIGTNCFLGENIPLLSF